MRHSHYAGPLHRVEFHPILPCSNNQILGLYYCENDELFDFWTEELDNLNKSISIVTKCWTGVSHTMPTKESASCVAKGSILRGVRLW